MALQKNVENTVEKKTSEQLQSFSENGNKKKPRKRQIKFIRNIMRKEGIENWTLTGPFEGKRKTAHNIPKEIVCITGKKGLRVRTKQHISLRATKHRKQWRAMIWQRSGKV